MNDQISELLKKLTLEEKASLCSGEDFWHLKAVERLHIPSIMVADGPHGLRKQPATGDHVGLGDSIKSTCFPTASASACSWDPKLLFEMGEALGNECLQEGISVILGPGANIKRSPLCGRNFEYISEDPYLTGKLGTGLVKGIQSKGIGTSLKHFAMNNQEYRRMITDSVADERTMREIYLSGFEEIIKEAQPWTVMCAYNRIEGTYCSDNKKLLTDILKEEWGHKGLVVTDWGACNDRVQGVKAGLELEMPSSGGFNDRQIVQAVNNGSLKIEDLDKVVTRILALILKAKKNSKNNYRFDADKHNELARKVAQKSAVLLKNDNKTLPLDPGKEVLIVGEFAEKPRYQGAGSSLINPLKVTSSLDELSKQNIKYEYTKGYSIDSDTPDLKLIEEAVTMAKSHKTVVIFTGLTDDYESEGFDRKHIDLPASHTKLIEAVTKVNNNVVVVLQNGAPVAMPWLENTASVLECYLGGQAGGGATVDILFGKVNPCGKLAETFPVKIEDDFASNYFGMGPKTVEYRESIYVGYRYYDSAEKEVLFPFGHGLSYTDFSYSDIKTNKNEINSKEELIVTCKIKNTGSIPGSEIVQLYVKDDTSTIFRPEKELKGFNKIHLQPGEEKELEFKMDSRSFAFYNTEFKDWFIESGDFTILLGASSRDIRLKYKVKVNSANPEVQLKDLRNIIPEYFNIKNKKSISNKSFEILLGRKIPLQHRLPGEPFTMTSTVGDVSHTPIGKELYKDALKTFLTVADGEEINPKMERMMRAIVDELPLRSLVLISGGEIGSEKVKDLLKKINEN